MLCGNHGCVFTYGHVGAHTWGEQPRKRSICDICGRRIAFGKVGYGRAHWYHVDNLFVSCQTLTPRAPRGSKATPEQS